MTTGYTGHRARLEALDAALQAHDLDGAVVNHVPSVRYLSGFTGSAGYVFHRTGGPTTLITDFRYEEQAAAEAPPGVRVHIGKDGWISALSDVCADLTDLRVAFEPENLTVLDLDRLEERVENLEFQPVRGLVTDLRAVKGEAEIEVIRRAAIVAESGLATLLSGVDWHDGPTEHDVAVELEACLRRAGSTGAPFDAIVASGERTSLPHATPSGRTIAAGDLLLLDFGATVDGYCSDITRTFVVGSASAWQVDLHARVLEAQTAAIDVLGPGVAAVDVDGAARGYLAAHDLDTFFGHSTGHGIGLEVHEEPRLSSRSEQTLVPGNVVTVEPGVYLPGRGGVRIEDDVVVTSSGSRCLTSASRDLIEL